MVFSKHAFNDISHLPATAHLGANTSRDQKLRGRCKDRPLGRAARRDEEEEGMDEGSGDVGADKGSWSQPGKAWAGFWSR